MATKRSGADRRGRQTTRGAIIAKTVGVLLALTLCGCKPAPVMTNGVPNLRVVDAGRVVYRSGQITTQQGWLYVKSLGVTTVIKLNRDSEGSDDGAVAVGLTVVKIPMPPSDASQVLDQPPQSDIHKAVDLAAKGHALWHCENDWDRSGLVGFGYRTSIDKWSRSKARREALADGFHEELLGLDDAMEDYEPNWVAPAPGSPQ
jgi:protein tyrosine/serine phosphatase